MNANRITNAVLLLMAGLFVAWAAYFIDATSLIAVNGRRYFCLFDDSMISMRYAWHFAHRNGLVWNPGEHVEGYTNLLMVLVMAIPNALVEQRLAVLSVQLFGIGTMLGIAYTATQIAVLLSPNAAPRYHAAARLLTFAGVLAYYPLAYWSLMGMETGLLALLVLTGVWAALGYRRTASQRRAGVMAVALGLAYLTRPESLLLSGLVLLYFFYVAYWAPPEDSRLSWRTLLTIGALFAALPLAQHLFRGVYYGELFSNTYKLKVVGMPVRDRLDYGLDYSAPFLKEHALLLGIAAGGVALRFSRARLLLAGMVFSMIVYQVYVGGDVPVWKYWRMVAPVIPLALALMIDALLALHRARPGWPALIAVMVVGAAAFYTATERFHGEQRLVVEPYQSALNGINVNTALLIDATTTDQASLGVFWAGTIPYYNPERYAIDHLGKSEPYIAGLAPDADDPMRGWPGHNKHDLEYSIATLQPTYNQGFKIGGSDISAWGREHYAALVYDANTLLYFRLGDSAVDMEAVFAQGMFPWMQWNTDAFFKDSNPLPDDAVILMPANPLGIDVPVVNPDQFTGNAAAAVADWQRTKHPGDLRAAGVDYLLIDNAWWDSLNEAERALLDNPANYETVAEWRVHYVFVRLYRVVGSA